MTENIGTTTNTGAGNKYSQTTQSSKNLTNAETAFLSAIAPPESEKSYQEDFNNTDLTPSRKREIDQWVEDNANAEDGFLFINFDDAGGERVSDALNGDTSLGKLSSSEKRHLIDAATTEWRQTGNEENIRQAAENLKDDESRRIVAEAYAAPSASDARIFEEGGSILTHENAPRAKAEMLKVAVELDPASVIDTFDGVEGALGNAVANMGLAHRNGVLQEVATGAADPTDSGIDKMVTALFLKSDSSLLENSIYRQNMSGALAQIMVNRNGASGAHELQQNVDVLAGRYDEILSTSGGRELLANDKVMPELRGWAMSEIANNPSLDAQSLKEGWESEAVSAAYAKPIINRYQARGVEPQVLGGEALRNTIGQAMGIKPDRLPPGSESEADAQARLADGMNHQYYGENKNIDAIAARIKELGGDQAQVTVMPVTVTNNEFGAATFNVFKVKGEDGKDYFIEDANPDRHYKGFEDWRSNSKLPPGQMTYVKDMEWGTADSSPELTTEATAQVTDTLGEWARKIGDGAALGVGIAAGVALTAGSGGTFLLVAAGAAGAWTTGRAAENLYDAHAHGTDITDLSNAEVRANWIDAAAGTLSFGAMGAAKVASLARGTSSASNLAKGAAGLQLAANTADAAAATNQAHDLATNWDDMNNSERAMGLLNVAFWGGMTAASSRAGGGSVTDAYSFTRLKNNIEFGAPYPVNRNPELQPNEMRIVYDVGANERATNIRIEHGGQPNPEMLALHGRTATQMEASGNLLDRIKTHFTDGKPAERGSAAWEAEYEIGKIKAEEKSIIKNMADPELSKADRARLEFRLKELETETAYQTERLNKLEERGEGWVASAKTGKDDAKDLGWPEAPDGYTWVAGADKPHLRRLDVENSEPLYFNPDTQTFSAKREMTRTGHGENEVTWKTDAQGQTTEVSATLREVYSHAGRSSAELSTQTQVGRNGLADDQGGHILGHRFVLNQGLKNMFPQDANLNTGAYKTLENELADWIRKGCDVNIDIKLQNFENGRPAEIEVSYNVVDPQSGKQVHKRGALFKNEGNQSFNRTVETEMSNKIAAARR
jgi:hypothetical protein